MASIKVIAAGYEAEIDIPDDDQVADAQRYDIIYQTTLDAYQTIALFEHESNKLTSLSALLLAIKAARAAALPELKLTPE